MKSFQQDIHKENLSKDIDENKFSIEILNINNAILELTDKCSLIIKSSLSGIITAEQINVGDSVDDDKPISIIVPDGSNIGVTLLIPSKLIGALSENDLVKIKYDSYPYQYYGSFKGRIDKIYTSTFKFSEIYGVNITKNDNVYIVKVNIDTDMINANGRKRKIMSGIKVRADIEVERRDIIDWLFSPIITLKGQL